MDRNQVSNVYPGQRVITSHGRVVVVAMVTPDGRVMAYDGTGAVIPVTVVCDAWGGEHEQTVGLESTSLLGLAA